MHELRTTTINTGTTQFHSLAFITTMNLSDTFQSFPILGFIALMTAPVLHGCESLHLKDGGFTDAVTVPVKVAVHVERNTNARGLDMLVFRNDRLQYLECWQRIPFSGSGDVAVASTTGEKVLMGCSGLESTPEDWMWVSSISSLADAWSALEKEIRDFPVMSGSCYFHAGKNTETQPELVFRRISSEIHLRTLKCDFKGKPYEGEMLSDIHVYLTNVNASCRIWNDPGTATRIINQGRLVKEDIARFEDQSLIYQKLEGEVGNEGIKTDIKLRCYPNMAAEEGPGSPFTRLVIQGELDGEVWYWPIDINRGEGCSPEGIEGNCVYTFDIELTRKGSADPDTAIKTESAKITMEVEKWEEKEEYSVAF